MKHFRHTLLLTFALFVTTLAARPCGPDFPQAIFVLQTGPGGDYASYAAGRIGIPQKSYRTRHMVVAYDYLSGHALPAGVQQQAVAVDRYLQDPWQADNDSGKSQPGYSAWASARSSFGPIDGIVPGPVVADRSVPGQDYESFNNCLDDAFGTAARTVAARIAAHGAKDPAVVDWVRAQDAVFTNCSDGKVSRYYGPPDKAPPPPPQPRAPLAAPASAPPWLRQDRAYQQAAASFYHLDFDNAARQFQAVAADTGSPWSATARYLVARSYLRKASLSDRTPSETPVNDQAKQLAAARSKAALTLAQHELVAMQTEPRMAPMRHAIDGLLDYVNLRLQPGAQAAVLAARLQSPQANTFHQAVLDLTWLHSTHDYDDRPVPSLNSAAHPDDMLAWIDAMYSGDEASALTHWRSTHTAAWLVAAMSYAKPGDSSVPELLQAARSVSRSGPGWLAVTYNRLRLSPRNAETRGEVLALLPQIRQSGDTSTINLFLILSTATAPGLEEWLASVPRTPAGFGSSDGEEDTQAETVVPSTNTNGAVPPPSLVEDVCGTKFPAGTVLPLFDTDAAVVFNREMPLRLLARAAESPALPAGLRFQVAQAAWTRAVLLDRPDIARRMTPLLIACRVAWTPVLAAYDGANTPDARHASSLLALMRFASTVPSVWDGEDRRGGFATYDELRENWWCTTVPRPGESVDYDPDRTQTSPQSHSLHPVDAQPPFLAAADRDEARSEVAALGRIPRASTYFALQALTWQKLHPADPQTPEILGQADRVVRNSCRKDPPFDEHGQIQPSPGDMTLTPNLAKALFDTLQRNYRNSTWAKRYKSWQ